MNNTGVIYKDDKPITFVVIGNFKESHEKCKNFVPSKIEGYPDKCEIYKTCHHGTRCLSQDGID